MKERPILFSGAMVRALLDGSKTQTRRIAPIEKLQITPYGDGCVTWSVNFSKAIKGILGSHSGGRFTEDQARRIIASQFCPHGAPGDRLYVRETWAQPMSLDPGPTVYRADYPACVPTGFENIPPVNSITWKPSIHMPRTLSRITLEITGVRVEQLQAMEGQTAFESDALKEGIKRIHHGDGEYSSHVARTEPHPNNWTDPCDAFRDLWDSLNAARGYGWVLNPWVWVVEFKRVTP